MVKASLTCQHVAAAWTDLIIYTKLMKEAKKDFIGDEQSTLTNICYLLAACGESHQTSFKKHSILRGFAFIETL